MNPDVANWIEASAEGPLSPLNIIALLAAGAIVFIAWQAWSARPRIQNVQQRTTTIPPGDLHPAYAGALATGRISDFQIEATVLELVRRGVLGIEPDPEAPSEAQIRMLEASDEDNPVEAALIRLLDRRSRNGVVDHNALKRIRNRWGPIRGALKDDLARHGWFRSSTMQTSLPFIVPGLIGIALAIALIIAAAIAGSGWPVIGSVIVGVTGMTALGLGSVVPQTTAKGEREAIAWRGFRSGLAQARVEAHGTLDLDRVFPYAVSMGMAAQFDRYLRRASQSGYVPDWIAPTHEVQNWPDGWHTYWIALHTALAPTDPANTTAPTGSAIRRSITGGRF